MTDKTKNIIVAIAILIILGLFFGLGYYAHSRFKPDPIQVNDTIFVTDTVEHHIVDSFPYYTVKRDTIIYWDTVFKDVDTAVILKDYFALHVYSRTWEDSLLKVNLRDTVTQNNFLRNDFSYKILRPQEVINTITNNYNYSRCVYVGLSLNVPDLKYSDISILYVFSRGYAGLGYIPLTKGLSLKGGLVLFKIK